MFFYKTVWSNILLKSMHVLKYFT